MSSTFVNPQQSDPAHTPEGVGGTLYAPLAYMAPTDAQNWLTARWPQYVPVFPLTEGIMLAASNALDLNSPFQGIKVNQLQEREFPRTYKIGYPNLLGSPVPVVGVSVRGGINLLNYDGVIPEQVIDWVCLEAFRQTAMPQVRGTLREAVDGASVTYGPDSQLDYQMFLLLQPFLSFQVSEEAWPNDRLF